MLERHKDGVALTEDSPLGIEPENCQLCGNFALVGEEAGTIDETYRIPAFKKNLCRDHANTLTLRFQNPQGILTVEARAYDDGAALRLLTDGFLCDHGPQEGR